MKNELLRRAAAVIFAMTLLSSAGCSPGGENERSGAQTTAGQTDTEPITESEGKDNSMNDTITAVKRGMGVNCADLTQSGDRSQRWLSIPGSRLVLNPYDFDANNPEITHPEASDSSALPLNVGYLDPYLNNSRGRGLYGAAVLLEDTGVSDAKIETLWSVNFESEKKWSHSGGEHTTVGVTDGALSLTVEDGAPEAWQYASQALRLDDVMDGTVITVTVDSCEGNWALKLNDGRGDDIKIQGDTNKTGTFTYKLSDYIDAGRSFRGIVKIFSIGYGKKLTVSGLEVRELSYKYAGGEEYSVTWMPHELSGSAKYKNGLELEYTDFFCDERTVARIIEIKTDGKLTVGGSVYGKITSSDGGVITVAGEKYHYSIAASREAIFTPCVDAPAMYVGQACTIASAGAYLLDFGEVKSGDVIVLTFSLGSDMVGAPDLAAAAQIYADAGAAAGALSAREAFWNDYLAEIPSANDFSFIYVDPMGVTAAQLKQLYCIAWVFAAQNLLPENTELDYNYMQVCCGKPSMWGYGEKRASYSATWESFFGMQLLAYTLPDQAWSAFTGLMSLVDEDGMLGGESLPSEKAHTAWVLYSLTGDSEKLGAVYDNIARYLDWRIENPRWIFLDYNDVNSADSDFAESALIDLKYMIKIAQVIRPGDAPSWQEKYDTLLENYKKWFFGSNGGTYQYCNKINFSRSKGNTIWVTKGFYIAELTGKYETMLIDRFDSEYNADASFCGFYALKYPDSSHTIYGLLNRGFDEQAQSLIEACARDVARVGMFSENYTNEAMPLPTGVRPSMFGCAMLIDSMLLRSGISYNLRLEE